MAQTTVDPIARDVLIKCAEEHEGLAKQATVQKSEELADRVKFGRPIYSQSACRVRPHFSS
jgi:hypothetical protein